MNNKLPLVILSSPRTGSSMILNYLGNLHNIPQHFNEPDGNNQMQEFENYAQINNNYAVKIHARHLFKFYQPWVIDQLLNSPDAYRVRIRRKNIIDQIASFYVAKLTNTWSYAVDKTNSSDVPIDIIRIKNAVDIIARFNEDLNTINTTFDLDIFYEDLPPMVDNYYKKTPRPTNYELVISTVKEHYYEKI